MKCICTVLIFYFFLSCNQQYSSTKHLTSNWPYIKTNGMVSSAHPLASQVGVNILKKGGNAFDASIAVKFVLAVVYPRAGNIAGGGFAVYRKTNGENGALDFREKAPLSANRDMYLDSLGEVIPKQSLIGHLSVGVPGTVEGMWQLHKKLGSLPFSELIQPAIDIATNGYTLTEKEALKLNDFQKEFYEANNHAMYFLNDRRWIAGDSIKLSELAQTLKKIQQHGADGFYKGETAKLILDEIKRGKGIITQNDLNNYKAIWRNTVSGTYKNYKIISMAPPSSGSIALLQLLKGIESYDLSNTKHNSTEHVHLMTELERRVYADRATFLGDPDYIDVPVTILLDSLYIRKRNSSINPKKKTDSQTIKEGNIQTIESIETTHFSIVDKDRNAIAISTTLNGNYGSKVFVKGAGFFLNNQMDDFSIKPGYPNQFGLVGAEANAIEPGKRMLSSMTPTVVEKNGELFLVLGTPGGSTIITSVFQTILNIVEFNMPLQLAIDAKKVHHQWLPDKILYEKDALSKRVISSLEKMGHVLEQRKPIGRVDAVMVSEDGLLIGGADKRGDDTALGY